MVYKAKTILLNGPIDYLVFNEEEITLFIDNQLSVKARMLDRSGDKIFIHFDTAEWQKLPVSEQPNLIASCNYRDMRLEFPVLIENADTCKRQLVLSIPNQGQLINCRTLERSRFEVENSELKAEFTISTLIGERKFISKILHEFSFKSISAHIDRRDGPVLINDSVEDIVIYNGEEVVFTAIGSVARVQKKDLDSDIIYVVIEYIDPTIKAQLDIEPNKRRSDRYFFNNKSDAFIEFTHPFLFTKKIAFLLDISNSGISIILQNSKHAMPPGMVISEASLQLPAHSRLDVKLKVRGFSRVEEQEHDLIKVSMEFMNPSPMLIKQISSYVQHRLSENLQDATYEDINELWQFYFETGFIYESKRRQLQSNAQPVKDTFKALLKSNTHLFKKILYKENDIIKGHITAIKVYDHSLMVQHLNALKTNSGSAAMQVIRGITSFFLDQHANAAVGNRYVCAYYRPDNLYPSLVFGQTAVLIDNEDICWTQDYLFCLPKEEYISAPHKNISVTDATAQDISYLETLLLWQNEHKIQRLEGLAREMLTTMAISEEYKRIGLYRYRKVFVAMNHDSGESVYAVCNYASPGLNFSELTNSITLFYHQVKESSLQSLINSVCTHALESYQDTDMKTPVLLLRENQPVPACFEYEKNYTLWVLDLNHVKQFRDSTEHIFVNIKEFVRKKKVATIA